MIFSKPSFAQITTLEQVTIFSSRLKNPIVFDVKYDTNNIYFNVRNNSQFPYMLELNFNEFSNLSPVVFDKKTIVLPGINKLFTFKIINKNEAPNLAYKSKYYLANINSGVERFSPYLVPIGKNRIVEFVQAKQDSSTKIFTDHFVMSIGDTVFSARKGIVTALPDNADELDRIMSGSLEIRHDDGTIALYLGLNPEIKFVKIGQKVFPSQPIGRIGDLKFLVFKVFEIIDDGEIASFDITYIGPNNKLLSSRNIRGLKVDYPNEIIIKEMSKREASKYKKNSLF